MKNPINKRIFRMLLVQPGKSLPLFFAMIFMVFFISSFLISQGSIKKLYYKSLKEQKVEDGQCTVMFPLSEKTKEQIEKENVRLYENFYKERTFNESRVLRCYKLRRDINTCVFSKGREPVNETEIAISYNVADANKLELGSTITLEGRHYSISGLIITPDYSSLLRTQADIVMDTGFFGIAVLTEKGFDLLGESGKKYCYAYHSNVELNEKDAREKLNAISAIIKKDNYVISALTRFDNRCITYVIDDMAGDVPMMMVLHCVIFIAFAFLAASQCRSLIEEEAPSIGTLLASGYKKSELLFHYLSLPLFLTILAAIIGNIIAYTIGYKFYAGLYYTSYTLLPFEVQFNMRALFLSTIVPIACMFSINFFMLLFMLRLTPLRFLRREFKKAKRRMNIDLSRFSFLTQFKIRVLLDNKMNMIVLFFGLFIASILLFVSLLFRPAFDNYAESIKKDMKYEIITMVKMPEENDDDLQKALILSVDFYPESKEKKFETQVYGLDSGSRYNNKSVPLDSLKANELAVSYGFLHRYKLNLGDTITLTRTHETEEKKLIVKTVFNDIKGLSLYMPMKNLQTLFDIDTHYYNAYFSDTKVTEIKDDNLITIIDRDKINQFLTHFLDGFASIFEIMKVVSAAFYFLIMYVLSKIILDKFKLNISYLKIFGFTPAEISKVYLKSLRNATMLFLLVSFPLVAITVKSIFEISIQKVDAYMILDIPLYFYPLSFAIALLLSLFVQYIQVKKIAKLDMVKELKTISG